MHRERRGQLLLLLWRHGTLRRVARRPLGSLGSGVPRGGGVEERSQLCRSQRRQQLSGGSLVGQRGASHAWGEVWGERGARAGCRLRRPIFRLHLRTWTRCRRSW